MAYKNDNFSSGLEGGYQSEILEIPCLCSWQIAISGDKLWQDEWIQLKLWGALKQQPVVNIIEGGPIIIFVVL